MNVLRIPSLPRGLRNPEETLRGFVGEEYEAYDAVAVMTDNVLRPEEIALSVMVNSRISGAVGRDIYRQRGPVEAALAAIDPKVSICDSEASIPWQSVERAISALCSVSGAKVAVATKILHKKRPRLIPILDSVMDAHYAVAPEKGRTWGGYTVALMRLFRRDLLAVKTEVGQMARALAAKGISLTPCRILEFLLWAAKEPRGYYESARWPADER